jgi:hypothetical protein
MLDGCVAKGRRAGDDALVRSPLAQAVQQSTPYTLHRYARLASTTFDLVERAVRAGPLGDEYLLERHACAQGLYYGVSPLQLHLISR